MIRIMFVCHGNICRSPMAEFIMKNLVKSRGECENFVICSSATSTEEIWGGRGNPMYPPAKAELKARGVPFTEREATQLKASDLEKYDLFIGMDSANIRNIHRILGKGCESKVYKLLSFAGSDRDVSDPWYSDRFDIAYDDIYKGCLALYNSISKVISKNTETN